MQSNTVDSSFDIDQVFDKTPEMEQVYFYLIGYSLNKTSTKVSEEIIDLQPIGLTEQNEQCELILSIICNLLNKEGGTLKIAINCITKKVLDEEQQLFQLNKYFGNLNRQIIPNPANLTTVEKISFNEKNLYQLNVQKCLKLEFNIVISQEKDSQIYYTYIIENTIQLYDFEISNEESSNSIETLSNSKIQIKDLFIDQDKQICRHEKVIKLRAYQYFQKEFVCIVNIFLGKKKQFETILTQYLKSFNLQFKILSSNNPFILIVTNNPHRMCDLLLQFKIMNLMQIKLITFNQEQLKFGKLRLQLLVRINSQQEEKNLMIMFSVINCAYHKENDHFIVFFYEYKDFNQAISQLRRQRIEFNFCFYQPFISQADGLITSINQIPQFPKQILSNNQMQKALSHLEQDYNYLFHSTSLQQMEYFKANPLYYFQYFQNSYNNIRIDRYILRLMKTVNQSNEFDY